MQPRGKKNFPVNFKGLVSQYSSIQPHWQKIPGKFDFHFLTDYLFLLLLESVFSILSNFLALLSMFSLQNFYEVESRYEFPSSFPPSLLPSFTSFRAGKCLYYLFLSFSFLCFPFWVCLFCLIALGLRGCACAFSRSGERGLLFAAVHRFSSLGLLSWWSTGSRGTGFSRCSTGTQQLQPESSRAWPQ